MSYQQLLRVLFVFVFTCGALCGDLFVVRSLSSEDGLALAEELKANGFDIYGFYGDIVVASPQDSQSALYITADSLEATRIGDLSYNYYVVERQERFGVAFSEALAIPQPSAQTLYSSYSRLVVSAPTDILTLDADLEVLPIPRTPITLGIRPELQPILQEIYENARLKYTKAPNPRIEELVKGVSDDILYEFVTYLTGEKGSTINSRNSIAPGALEASKWISSKFESWGLEVSTQQFRADYSSNVIGIRYGVTDRTKVVVVGAHYDSRGPTSVSATQRAPGANDNGSGTGAVLHIAKIFHDYNATFDYTIHFITYSGEEQGLYGSAAYAQKLVDEKVDVVGVLNADMIAYRVPSEVTQAAFPSRYSTPALETVAREATATYVPALTIGITTACCSDHQSYYTRGLPATGFFERNGAIADPQYHRSEDLVIRTGYDIPGEYHQLTSAVLATLATVAGVKD